MTMTKLQCSKADCTFNLTERCLESHAEPGKQCPNIAPVPVAGAETTKAVSGRPAAPASRRFHQGFELGIADAQALMRGSYVHVVGILGVHNAGKTSLLTSLYLQITNRSLQPTYSFAGSFTLQGFEHRARRLRRWTPEGLPDRIVDRTVLTDPRRPAFVHLSLDAQGLPQRRVELLLSDLPGEWSSSLINRADVATRFDFLARADAIVLVVDGPNLANNTTRHLEALNARNLLVRLANDVKVSRDTRLLIVVSKFDKLDSLPNDVGTISGEAERLGFKPQVIPIAAVSRRLERTPHGFGLHDFVTAITKPLDLTSGQVVRPSSGTNMRSFARPWRYGA
jgi:hypothetical protein